jgi:hypothetical protein
VGLSAIATLSYAKDSPKARTLEVQRALVVCRHGDRTPAFWANNKIGFQTITPEEKEFWSDSNSTIIPTSEQVETWRRACPYNEKDVASVTGTLTLLGAAAHIANGIWVRRRYVHEFGLLPENLKAGDVLARSTPFPRCIQSAQNLLLGLYPMNHRTGTESPWKVIQTPIHTNNRGLEPMYGAWFATADGCPRIIQVIFELYDHLEKKKSAEDLALEERVRKEIGAEADGNLPLADAIRCGLQYKLPNGFGWDNDFAIKVRDYCWKTFMRRYECPEYNSLLVSEMLPELLEGLDPIGAESNVYKPQRQKLTVMLGHDAVPMLPLLLALGVWDGKWPDYASMLVLETVRCAQTGETYVRCIYNQEEKILPCAGPNGLCKWDDFVAMLKKVEVDYDKACKPKGNAPIRDVCAEAPGPVLLQDLHGGWGAHRFAAKGKGGVLSWHGVA